MRRDIYVKLVRIGQSVFNVSHNVQQLCSQNGEDREDIHLRSEMYDLLQPTTIPVATVMSL